MLLYINKILTRTVLLLGPGMVGTVIVIPIPELREPRLCMILIFMSGTKFPISTGSSSDITFSIKLLISLCLDVLYLCCPFHLVKTIFSTHPIAHLTLITC